ncbi:MAG TPA: indole-3-glycerol-phosphate synthase TrpC, partial [Verrucomicrobiae bacterium]
NRDLKTSSIDLATTMRLGARLGNSQGRPDRILVAESGIQTRADVERLQSAGARAILVGESLMKSGDIRGKVMELLAL